MNENTFEIIWPYELEDDFTQVITSTQENADTSQVHETQTVNETAETFLVVGAILALGVVAAYAQHRTSRDTAEAKNRLN